ncbi:MAG: hypothetical protein IJC93_08310 [Clostridia bacterium]|nr:hypothetical protein [Clostridia bacterium]
MKISLWWKSLSARQKHLLILRAAAAVLLGCALFFGANSAWEEAANDRTRLCGALLLALVSAVPLIFGRYVYTLVTLAALGIGAIETRSFLAVASPYAETVRETQAIVIYAVTLGAAIGAVVEILLARRQKGNWRVVFSNQLVQAGLAFLAMLIALNVPLYETGYWPGERVLLLSLLAAAPFLVRFYAAAAAYFLTYALAGQMGNLVAFLGGGLGPQAGPYGTHSGAMIHAVPVLIAVVVGAAIDLIILSRKRKQTK